MHHAPPSVCSTDTTVAAAILNELDDLPSSTPSLEHVKEGVRAAFDVLLDQNAPDAALLAFADQHDLELLGLDTGELPLNPPTNVALLSAGVVSDVRTGRVA